MAVGENVFEQGARWAFGAALGASDHHSLLGSALAIHLQVTQGNPFHVGTHLNATARGLLSIGGVPVLYFEMLQMPMGALHINGGFGGIGAAN